MNCIGVALGIFWATCTLPQQPAPTEKAPFCNVVRQAGGVMRPSRKDTPESARYMNRLGAAYRADCK